MKKMIAVGAAALLLLSAGMVVSAGHHAPCMGRVLQSSALCRYRADCDGSGCGVFWHNGGHGCGFWRVDVDGVCDAWEYCQAGYGTGTAGSQYSGSNVTGNQTAGEALPAGQGENPVSETQDAAGFETDQAPETQGQLQPEAGSAAAGTYGGGVCYPDSYGSGNAGYGNRGHHEDWHHGSGNYGSGHHGSGHHGCR